MLGQDLINFFKKKTLAISNFLNIGARTHLTKLQ